MRAVLVRALRTAVQALAAVLLAGGLGGLVALAVAIGAATAPAGPAGAALLAIAMKATFISLLCAGAAFMLLPRAAELIPRSFQPPAPGASRMGVLVMTAVAAAVLSQVPATLAWWTASADVLRHLPVIERDPLGLDLIPKMVLLSTPALASLALVSGALSAALVGLVRRDRSLRALAASTAVQAGFVLGAYHSLAALRVVRVWLEEFMASMPEGDPARVDLTALARHADLAAPRLQALVYLLGGAAAALVVTGLNVRRKMAVTELDALLPAPPPPAHFSPSSAARLFESSSYAVKARGPWIERLLFRSCREYEIQSVPPRAGQRFVFVRRVGVIRREPDGPDVIVLRGEGRGWFSRKYIVTDAVNGATLGSLTRAGRDWTIANPHGLSLATVVEDRRSHALVRYPVVVGGREICAYTWATAGASISSALLDVDLPPESQGGIDRALLVALAPLLEAQARLGSRG